VKRAPTKPPWVESRMEHIVHAGVVVSGLLLSGGAIMSLIYLLLTLCFVVVARSPAVSESGTTPTEAGERLDALPKLQRQVFS